MKRYKGREYSREEIHNLVSRHPTYGLKKVRYSCYDEIIDDFKIMYTKNTDDNFVPRWSVIITSTEWDFPGPADKFPTLRSARLVAHNIIRGTRPVFTSKIWGDEWPIKKLGVRTEKLGEICIPCAIKAGLQNEPSVTTAFICYVCERRID